VSAPDACVTIQECATDVVEIVAHRAASRDTQLPAMGRAAIAGDQLHLSVRPGRWLLLSEPAASGAAAARWESVSAGSAAAIDLSSGLVTLFVQGAAAREMLTRGCRLDLDPTVMPAGSAAATLMAQVAVTLVALPAGLLLLTPSTTARHLREWLASTAQPFGFAPGADLKLTDLLRSEWS
jgi:heterotetrameric sarcosine oxidase gamma subunit